MKDNTPSTTALRVAMCRAAHRISDDPNVFSDPLALRIVGIENMQPDTDSRKPHIFTHRL